MIEIIKESNAKHYAFKYTNDQQFTECCHKGLSTLPKNPPDLEELNISATEMTIKTDFLKKFDDKHITIHTLPILMKMKHEIRTVKI